MSPDVVQAGLELGGYRLLARLGANPHAEVWSAELSGVPGPPRALAVLRARLASDANFLERFFQEAEGRKALQHPHLLGVEALGEQQGRLYVVTELPAGSTLEAHLGEHGRLEAARAVALLGEALDGVAHAHHHQLLHRELQPAALFLTTQGPLKVLGFGAARYAALAQPSARRSPAYLAPELARGKRASPASDVYSLGVTLFQLLAGELPFEPEPSQTDQEAAVFLAYQHVHASLPDLRERGLGVSEELWTVVERATAKEPGARYATAAELGEALRAAAPLSATDRTLPGTRRDKPTLPARGAEGRTLFEPFPLAEARTLDPLPVPTVADAGPTLTERPTPLPGQPTPAPWAAPTPLPGMPTPAPTFTTRPTPAPEPTPAPAPAAPAGSWTDTVFTEPPRPADRPASAPAPEPDVDDDEPLQLPSRGGPGRRVAIAAAALLVLGAGAWWLLSPGEEASSAAAADAGASAAAAPAAQPEPGPPPGMVAFAATRFQLGDAALLPLDGPPHPVEVAPFFLDLEEVSIARARAYAAAHPTLEVPLPPEGVAGLESKPATRFSHPQAAAFCAWAHPRGRLPTEAEWELAARGAEKRPWPWGAAERPDCLNAGHGEDAVLAEVSAFACGATPQGVLQLAGNVAEWTASPAAAYPGSPVPLPEVFRAEPYFVVRGGSAADELADARPGRRMFQPAAGGPLIGFRCAADPPPAAP